MNTPQPRKLRTLPPRPRPAPQNPEHDTTVLSPPEDEQGSAASDASQTYTDNKGAAIIPAANVPGNYAFLGVVSGWSPTPWQRLRSMVLGPVATGKTGLVTSNNRALVWDTEDSAGDAYRGCAARVHVKTISQIIGAGGLLETLERDGPSPNRPFDHVAIDTFDKLIELAIDYLSALPKYASKCDRITEYGSKGSGWYILRDFLMDILNRIYNAGYGWTVTGHLTEKSTEVNGMMVPLIRPVMAPSISEPIFRDAQFIWTTQRRNVRKPIQFTTKQGGKTVTKTTFKDVSEYLVKVDYPEGGITKGRYTKYMPEEVPVDPGLGWPTLEAVYQSCIEQEQADIDSLS